MERFNKKVEGKEKYLVKIPNTFTALGSLDGYVDINSPLGKKVKLSLCLTN
jgi:hypothetical protein